MKSRLEQINMSHFWGGRNGEDLPTDLLTSKGTPTGQGVEQINIRTLRNALENRGGEQAIGNEITGTGGIHSLHKIGNYILAVKGTVLYYLNTNNIWTSLKIGLTNNIPMSFVEYYGKVYCNNGIDTPFEIVNTGTNTFTVTNRTGIPKSIITTEYINKMWVGGWNTLQYSNTASPTDLTKIYNFTTGVGLNAGSLILPDSSITAMLTYRNVLYISTQTGIWYIQGLVDGLIVPTVEAQRLYTNNDGAVNERCFVLVGGDMMYFTGKRVKRLFVPEFEGVRLDEGIDRPILDILDNDLATDQSQAVMSYNPATGLMFLYVKSKNSSYNDLRIVYSTKTNAWWKETGVFARSSLVADGKSYYGNHIVGKVIQDDVGDLRDGYGDTTFYESRHIQPSSSLRSEFRHLYLDGLISTNTIITVIIYVDNKKVKTVTVTKDDITEKERSSQALGDEVLGDSMWGGGIVGEEEIEDRLSFEKWIAIGVHGKEFHYTISTNGEIQKFRIDTAILYRLPRGIHHRLQSTN